ncbi:hypothetical protein JL721_9372 [Aureococcus anophagefferens]|nr:hypothetical protein JL721_9372 [Aureococcus anophagefferens]
MAARALRCALLLAQACAAQELQRTSVFAILNAPLQAGEVRHRIAVRGDGNRVVAHLELSGAEEVADAAYAFGVANGVDRGSTRRLAAAVCGGQGLTAGEPAPPCGREGAALRSGRGPARRDGGGRARRPPAHLGGQDALDAVHGFLLFELDLWFGDWFPPALVEALCGALAHPLWPCGEAPVARTVPINMGAETGKVGDLVLREDEEAADAIALFAKDREEITAHAKKQLYASVCGGNEKRKYRCTRERALLFRGGPARNGNGTMILASDGSPAFVEVWDGDEPADAAFAWSRVHAAVDVDDARHLVRMDKGCEAALLQTAAANLCENPLVSCTRNKAVVWTALVDVATLETLGWPPPYGNVHLEVYEGGAVVDAVRELWFSRNESEGLFGPDARLLRRSLTALACSPDYGLAPETLCARAEEILASADVERPGAAKTMVFNYTTPRAFDDRPCGDAVDRRRAYDEQVVVRDVACAPKEEKRPRLQVEAAAAAGSKRRDDDDDDDGDDALTRMKKRRDRDRKERGLPPIDDATSRTAAPPDDDGDGGDDANATNATAPAPAPNATTPWRWAPATEADRRGVQQGMKLRKVDGVAVRDQDTPRVPLRGPPAPGCEDLNATTGAPIYAPRFLLFEMPLQFGGMTHTFRYYPDDWPPCPGEYNPTAWSVPDTTLHWPFGADEATLEALSLALGGEDPLPKLTNASCAPAIERFAASVCDALGPPRPPGCDVDLLNIAKQYLQQAMEHRWFEKATPDGVDLYLALGAPRDSDNDTISLFVNLTADASGLAARESRRAVRAPGGADALAADPARFPDGDAAAALAELAEAGCVEEKRGGHAAGGPRIAAAASRGKVQSSTLELTKAGKDEAADAAVEANHTIRALEKPVGEVSKRAWALHQAFDTLADETNRDFYDRPCRPVFGACCVRDAPDGGMRITCGS